MEIKMELNDKQIEFMKYMETTVLPNRNKIGYETLQYAGNLVGISINTGCRSCAQKSGMDLVNLYGQLKPAWITYHEQLKLKETIQYTNYIEPDTTELPVKADVIEPIIGVEISDT
jgi:hypothetical protein